jgi:hypothetical protein
MMPFGGPTPMHPVDPGPGEIRECREVGVADQPNATPPVQSRRRLIKLERNVQSAAMR